MAASDAPGITQVGAHLGDGTQEVLGYYSEANSKELNERKKNARDITHSYYQLATDFYEYGYSDCFHFAPVYSGKSLKYCLTEYERRVAVSLQAKPGMRLLV